PLGPPPVEGERIDPAAPAALTDEESGDEGPREDEEVVERHPSADEPGQPEVVQEQQGREVSPQSVERSEATLTARGRHVGQDVGGPTTGSAHRSSQLELTCPVSHVHSIGADRGEKWTMSP